MRCIGQVEIDPFCRKVLEMHWPDVPRFEDVRNFDGKSIGTLDLIAGGFPCQPFSTAGKQKGKEDERHLWPHFARLIADLRPRWVLAENVPGLRNIAADEVIGDLEELGYAVWPIVVGAEHVGAPHRRHRVWIVAYRDYGQLDDAQREILARWIAVECGGYELADAKGIDGRLLLQQGRTRQCCSELERTSEGAVVNASTAGISGKQHRRMETGPETKDQRQADHDMPDRSSSQCLADSAQQRFGTRRPEPAGLIGEPGTAIRGSPLADAKQDGRRAGSGEPGNEAGAWQRGSEPARSGIVADAEIPRYEGQEPAGNARAGRCAGEHGGIHWPSRPGEPQREWEEPRLVEFDVGRNFDGFSRWMDRLDRNRITHKLMGYVKTTTTNTGQELPELRTSANEEAIREAIRRSGGVYAEEVLRPEVHGGIQDGRQPDAQSDSATGAQGDRAWGQVRGLWSEGVARETSPERKPIGQQERECCDSVCIVSQQEALAQREKALEVSRILQGVRDACKTQGILSEALVPFCEIWRSATDEEKRKWHGEVGASIERRLRRQNRESLKAAGNAVVPQVVELIGRWIIEADRRLSA